MQEAGFVPLTSYSRLPAQEMMERAAAFRSLMQCRRSVRRFSSERVPREVIEDCLLTAGSAPSGANKQPWHFVVVNDPAIKRNIRQVAEEAEYEFYHGRAGSEWLQALSHLGTDHEKQFLEEAPCLIVVFAQSAGDTAHGKRTRHYYVSQSVGIATGFLLAAIHNAGLAALPYTPSRMGFLRELLGRGKNERPFLMLAVGYPAQGVTVPEIEKKQLDEFSTFV